MPVSSVKQRTEERLARPGSVKSEDQKLMDRLRRLAEEVTSELSELDPPRGKELLGAFVSELYLSLAERELSAKRSQRQTEAIAAAKSRGVRFGREPIPLPDGFAELAEEWRNGRVSAVEAGRILGISRHTFKRRATEWVQSAEADGDAL